MQKNNRLNRLLAFIIEIVILFGAVIFFNGRALLRLHLEQLRFRISYLSYYLVSSEEAKPQPVSLVSVVI